MAAPEANEVKLNTDVAGEEIPVPEGTAWRLVLVVRDATTRLDRTTEAPDLFIQGNIVNGFPKHQLRVQLPGSGGFFLDLVNTGGGQRDIAVDTVVSPSGRAIGLDDMSPDLSFRVTGLVYDSLRLGRERAATQQRVAEQPATAKRRPLAGIFDAARAVFGSR